jgi:uncharacterized protein (TIGR02172 family)
MNGHCIGNGRTAEVFTCDDGSVLKLFKPFMPKESIDAEFGIASYAYEHKLPTPKPLSLVTRDGRTGIAYEKVEGESLLRSLSRNPLRMTEIAREMARLHHRIHSVPFGDGASSQKANMERAINAASSLSDGDKETITACLRALPDGTSLCHGDFHPDNILVGDGLWIIDWMTGSSGNPQCDAARCKMILETSEIPDSVSPVMRFVLQTGKKRLAKRYMAEYCKISGTRKRDIDRWLLPLYAARLCENLSQREERVVLGNIRKELAKR